MTGKPAPIIEARGVEKSFGHTPALRGATIAVARGEILAVMGPSGSGKSTLLHCLAGILIPDEGEVWFDGSRLDSMPEGKRSDLRRDRFGFVFQFGQLVPELTAEENVALPLLLSGVRRGPALAEARRFVAKQSDLQWAERSRCGFAARGRRPRPRAKQAPPRRRGPASARATLTLLGRAPSVEAASGSPLEGWKPAAQTRQARALQVRALQIQALQI